MPKTSILLGTPLSSDLSMLPAHHLSVVRLLTTNVGLYQYHSAYVRSADVAHNRNLIWKAFVHDGFDYLFLVDSDMTFKVDAVHEMVQYSRKNDDCVVSGIARMGSPPYHWALFDHKRKPMEHLPEEGVPFEQKFIGTFGMIIPKSIIPKMKTKNPFKRIKDWQEDLSFCWQLQQSGVSLVVIPDILFDHWRTYPVSPDAE